MKKILIFLIAGLLTISSFSQDIIVLRNGDEVKSKVIEITPEIVKYKNWANIEGPIYSTNKSEIFMIKYANGTKDLFNTVQNSNSNAGQINLTNDGSKYIGTWLHKRYDGLNNKTKIIISKAGNDYLVEYKRMEKGSGEYFFDAQGSFKEVGRMEGNSIVINSSTKLSLINERTVLMDSKEYVKSGSNTQTSNSNTTINSQGSSIPSNINNNSNNQTPARPSYDGELKEGKKEGKGKQIYEDGSTYEGEWKNNKRNGYGTFLCKAGKGYVYKGYWKDDKRDSIGVTKFPNYEGINEFKFEGTYKDDKEYNGVLYTIAWGGDRKELIITNGVSGKWKKIKNK